MTNPQSPISNSLDWLLALLPILVVLVLMLRFRWGAAKAGAVGWLAALLVAALRFGAGRDVLIYAQLKGLFLTLFVLYVIWAALLFYRVTDEAGALSAIGAGLPRLTPRRGLQALLLAWAFGAFLQGVSGFGVPVAIVAPLLVGLGFPAVAAVVIASVGHSWAVTFGSLGSSFYTLIGATGRSGEELAPWCALMLGLACLGCGAGTLWAAGGKRALLSNLVPLFIIGPVMAAAQFLVVTNGMWSIGGMTGGLAGLAVGVAWARREHGSAGFADRTGAGFADHSKEMPFGWALLPYALLIAIVLVARLIPPARDFLGQVVIRASFPELTTSRGWVTPAGTGRAINLFGHAGALLVYAALITYGLFQRQGRYTPGTTRRIARAVVQKAARSSLGIAAMVGMALTMEHAGMTHLLAQGIARVAGPAFPLVSPFIGALGAFMTGSNTNSNVVFGGMQQHVAALVGVSPLIILAAQTTGGAIGSMFAPAKIIVGCSTVGLGGREGPVLRAAMRYGLAIVAGLALATVVAVYLKAVA
ncbi:MAG: L-lactate permease [Chloroflexi bacterium]|nr:MAG: L-lactate permease [Chloroflexota bacterium]RLC84627.1 MAG: L-lactate permease [Chloroflexota bacterium]